jgi:hypothetical protein
VSKRTYPLAQETVVIFYDISQLIAAKSYDFDELRIAAGSHNRRAVVHRQRSQSRFKH